MNKALGSFARAAAIAAFLTAGAAAAQQGGIQPVADFAELVTAQATVASIDQSQRKMTLKLADGRSQVVKVGPQVTNFDKVKAGDIIKVAFYQDVAVDITPPGKANPGITTVDLATRARPGALPAGAVVNAAVFSSEIVGIEPDDETLVLIDPNGNVRTIEVLDPNLQAILPSLKLGDKYDVVITEGFAVAIDPAK